MKISGTNGIENIVQELSSGSFFDPAAYTMANASLKFSRALRGWKFRLAFRSNGTCIDPFLVLPFALSTSFGGGYNARTRCQSIWKSVIAFHFMNSNVMRGNEFNARDTYRPRGGLVFCFTLPFYGVPSIQRIPFSLFTTR